MVVYGTSGRRSPVLEHSTYLLSSSASFEDAAVAAPVSRVNVFKRGDEVNLPRPGDCCRPAVGPAADPHHTHSTSEVAAEVRPSCRRPSLGPPSSP